MRDAQSLLDQVLAFAGDQPGLEDLDRITGRVSREQLSLLLEAIDGGDLALVVERLTPIFEGGTEASVLTEQLAEELRLRLHRGVSDGWQESDVEANLLGQEILQETRQKLRRQDRGDLLLEIALMRTEYPAVLGPHHRIDPTRSIGHSSATGCSRCCSAPARPASASPQSSSPQSSSPQSSSPQSSSPQSSSPQSSSPQRLHHSRLHHSRLHHSRLHHSRLPTVVGYGGGFEEIRDRQRRCQGGQRSASQTCFQKRRSVSRGGIYWGGAESCFRCIGRGATAGVPQASRSNATEKVENRWETDPSRRPVATSSRPSPAGAPRICGDPASDP